jgi:chemotaxis protein CheX
MSRSAHLTLPPALDVACASELAVRLTELRGAPLVLEASAVERVTALGLQVLLSARLTWAADGAVLAVRAPSSPFQDAVRLSGAQPFDVNESPQR